VAGLAMCVVLYDNHTGVVLGLHSRSLICFPGHLHLHRNLWALCEKPGSCNTWVPDSFSMSPFPVYMYACNLN